MCSPRSAVRSASLSGRAAIGTGADAMRLHRLMFAALAGAAVMFAWSALSHTLLIRGDGFAPLPNETALLAEMRESIKDEGLYFFPGIDWSRHPNADETAAWEQRFRAGNGLLVFHPSSDAPV